MKLKLTTLLLLTLAVAGFAYLASGCSTAQNEQIARNNPRLAPATQAVEKIEQAGDKVAEGVVAVAGPVRDAAHAADAAGVPYAGLVELIAGIVAGAGTFYLGHRKGKGSMASPTTIGTISSTITPPPAS